jgi:5,6-dimethylbenzimidazole synthase
MRFNKKESKTLKNIIVSRRDIRGNNFLSKKIKPKKIKKILNAGLNAPSVGFSQPWRFVVIEDKNIKKKIYKNFKKSYKKSKKYFKKRKLYNSLKLEGILETPVNIAVFYKKSSKKILGQTSQKQMGEYSTVCAIQNMWLMARSLNIGIGWVSILDHDKINKILNKRDRYKLVGYLCVGYTKKFLNKPELQILKWEKRKKEKTIIEYR